MVLKVLLQHFPQLAEKQLQDEILACAQEQSLPAGAVLMDYGQYIRAIPLIYKGIIKIMRSDEEGNELLLYMLGAGDTCPMSFTCCTLHKQSEIRAVVEEDADILMIPADKMDRWMSYQSWKNFVMTSYNRRFEELLQTIDNIAFRKMDERLWQYLQDMARTTGKSLLSVTHQQIATELNTAREAISRLLKRLEREGYVRLGRNQIELLK